MDQALSQNEMANPYTPARTDDAPTSSNANTADPLQSNLLSLSTFAAPVAGPSPVNFQRPEVQSISASSIPFLAGVSQRRGSSDDEDEDEDEDANVTASGRRSRSQVWPPLSDPTPTVPQPIVFQRMEIGYTGRNSGRNLMALFQGGDGVPRTRYQLRINGGRAMTYLPHVRQYPDCTVSIPGGLSLTQICQSYPRHVWGTGLRLFIAEGWTGEKIFNALPKEFQDSKAAVRPWNFIQQGFTREVRRIKEEDDAAMIGPVPAARKRTVTHAGLDNNPVTLHPSLRARRVPSLVTYPRQVNVPSHLPHLPNLPRPHVPQYPAYTPRQAELIRQERIMIEIMHLRSRYGRRPLDERLDRARCARILFLRMIGIELDQANEAHLRGLTMFLQEELFRARRRP